MALGALVLTNVEEGLTLALQSVSSQSTNSSPLRQVHKQPGVHLGVVYGTYKTTIVNLKKISRVAPSILGA